VNTTHKTIPTRGLGCSDTIRSFPLKKNVKKSIKKLTVTTGLLALLLLTPVWASDDQGHDNSHAEQTENDQHGHDESEGHSDNEEGHEEKDHEHEETGHEETGHEEESGIKLDARQIAMGNIVVETLQPRQLSGEIRAPGEVIFNAYRSSKITPRISAQIVKRHTRLGETVKRGQALVTLSSVEMAEAQGDLLVADREWLRVKKLGRTVVSDKRYISAQVASQQAIARVLAFGMNQAQVDALLREGDPVKATGRFDLFATQAGTVTRDDFIIGEIVEPGRVLFDINDERSLWVEARLTPENAHQIHTQAPATIRFGQSVLNGKVTQIHHALDEDTRTLAVRIAIANPDDRLHPGLFVSARIQTENTAESLSVPIDAALRSPDGDWQLFVEEEPGHFQPKEIEVVRTVGDRLIIRGIEPGTRVVTGGAFFVQSELAKSGFSVHNH
jgi:RND family efflux transporter MFP subunit